MNIEKLTTAFPKAGLSSLRSMKNRFLPSLTPEEVSADSGCSQETVFSFWADG